ncbi:MAG: Wzz/FepE/Etk N-terminal domain-containing protein [Actinomycetes bacterium]
MENVSGQQGGATLGEYSGALRRRWWVVALGAFIGLGLAATYLLIAPKTYLATSSVQVNSVGGELDNAVEVARTNSGINLDTEAQLVTSQAVSSRAKVTLQTPEIVGQLVQHVSVDVPPNTSVLRISFSASSPEEARDGAAAYADAYLANRRDSADALLEQQVRALNKQIAELQAQLETASDDERPGIQSSLDTVNTRLAILDAVASANPGKVISDSLLPRRATSPNTGLVLTSGLAFGLLLGLAALYLLERRDGRCYDWQSVERQLGLAVLADIPGTAGSPAQLYAPHSPGAEAFGQVRNAVLAGLGEGPATLVIASPSTGYGADVVAANLAVALARAGHRTTLVVADESSLIADMFGMPATDGLTEVLRGRLPLARATLSVPDQRRLSLLTAGHGLNSQIDDLEGSGIEAILSAVASDSTFVLIRARANTTASDAQYFGRHARAAIPVIEIGLTVRDAVEDGVRQWRLVDTPVPGVVTVPAFDAPDPAAPRAVATSSVNSSGTTQEGATPKRDVTPKGPPEANAPLGKASPSR